MIKKRRSDKIFLGWWIVLATSIMSFWGHGYVGPGFSALFKPISSELGFSRAVTSVGASVFLVVGGLGALVTGWITDRFGPRWIMLVGVLFVGLGLVMMNFIESLWSFYVVWGVILGIGSGMALYVPQQTAVSNWFVKKRGLALGVREVAIGLAGVLVLPLIVWLITTQGWRMTCLIGGVVMWVIGLPLTWLLVKPHRPEYYGLLPDGATAEEVAVDTSQMIEKGVKYAAEVEEVEFTLRQALRTPTYWLIIAAMLGQTLIVGTIFIHGIPFLTDFGLDILIVAGIFAMMSFVGLPVRLGSAFLVDRIKREHLRFLLVGAFLLEAAGITAFLLHQTIAMIYVWFILHGLGTGITGSVVLPMRGRYFGRKAYGSIAGVSQFVVMIVGVATPIYAGWVYDTTGSYMTVFKLSVAALVVAIVLAFLISPPKLPAQITDTQKIV